MSDLIKVVLLGILEGITEFLPVSSTGHLFIAQNWLGIDLEKAGPEAAFWKAFGIVIQIGAILAVVIYFRTRILDLLLGRRVAEEPPTDGAAETEPRTGEDFETPPPGLPPPGSRFHRSDLAIATALRSGKRSRVPRTPMERYRGVIAVAIGTLPIYATGLFVGKIADKLEAHPTAIALALFIGGVLMLIIEKIAPRPTTHRLEDITWKQALVIGCTQILAALFPGTSRSAATIMPGLCAGLSRSAAAEFSFFLAIPAMFAACGYKMLKWVKDNHPNSQQLLLMAIGTLVSFLVAWVVIAGFMAFIRRNSFVVFAVYRIGFGLFVLAWIWVIHKK